jgi:hypothetical protein
MLWESCSSSYTEHNKIGFAIFGFFCDFIRFFKVAATTHKRGKIHFANRPLESFGCSQLCPWFTITPPERIQSKQCSPGGMGRRGRPDSGDLAGELGRGVAGEALGVVGNRTWVLTRDGNHVGGRPRRRSAAAAAGGSSPANWRLGPDNKWLEELWWCMRKGAVHSRGHRANRNKELAARPLMAGWRLCDRR